MELKCIKCDASRSKGKRLCNKCIAIGRRRPIKPLLLLAGEEWLPIDDFPRYCVSSHGRIMSLFSTNSKWENPIILRLGANKLGYKTCTISPGKSHGVHRLVAMAFIPNPDNKPEVNHKDFDPTNNHIDNLEWATHKENLEYSARAGRFSHSDNQKENFKKLQESKRTPVDQYSMDGTFIKRFETAKEAGAFMGRPNSSNIGLCCRGKIKYCYGYRWKFSSKQTGLIL
jgi:hypothetical protein